MGMHDKASDKAQEVKGEVKETVGGAVGDDDLKARGKADQTKSALKEVGEKVKDAAAHLRDTVTHDR